MNPSGENARIRRMTAEDLARVMEIAASLPEAPHWAEANYRTALDAGASPRRVALVAEGPEGEVLGFVVANVLEPQAELETIAVAAASQRRGLGRQLFDALTEELRMAGVAEVLLEVRASNHAAHAFYRSVGFGRTGIRPRYYTDPIEDAVLMGLKLG